MDTVAAGAGCGADTEVANSPIVWPDTPPASVCKGQLPVCYRSEYNITAGGLEKLHPFDSCKYGRIFQRLADVNVFTSKAIVSPPILSDAELAASQTSRYLSSLKSSVTVARITEVAPAAILPNFLVKWRVLTPMLYASKGTIMATQYALQVGYGINLGGGFHHASRDHGHGFCVYNDISMAIWSVRKLRGPTKVMIVDLDAHQGDGHETDFMGDRDVHIFDAFTPGIFPNDRTAMMAIKTRMHFRKGDDGTAFLRELKPKLAEALASFTPDLVIYNAGTDILEGDPLSGLSITAANVIARDETVFAACGYQYAPVKVATSLSGATAGATVAPCRPAAGTSTGLTDPVLSGGTTVPAGPVSSHITRRFIPVAMVLSGGYQKVTADVIADSLMNLHRVFGIMSPSWMPPPAFVPWNPLVTASTSAVATGSV